MTELLFCTVQSCFNWLELNVKHPRFTLKWSEQLMCGALLSWTLCSRERSEACFVTSPRAPGLGGRRCVAMVCHGDGSVMVYLACQFTSRCRGFDAEEHEGTTPRPLATLMNIHVYLWRIGSICSGRRGAEALPSKAAAVCRKIKTVTRRRLMMALNIRRITGTRFTLMHS